MREWARRHHFILKRLHTFTGVLPLGAFLTEHLWTNVHALQGPAAYNSEATFLESLPGLILIEILVIWLPLLYHAVYGVAVLRLSHPNVRRYNYLRNWLFTLQRFTGVIALIFIAWHFWEFRLQSYFYGKSLLFAQVAQDLHNPWMDAFYAIGVLSVVYHFANGLWSFGVDWGLLVGRRAQAQFTWVSVALFVVLSTMGLGALYAFAR